MEKQVNWGLNLSLQQMALGRVAIDLWNECDILSSIENCRFKSLSDDSVNVCREALENKVKYKVSKLVLPRSVQKQMIDLVRPMMLDTLTWKKYHERILCVSGENLDIRVLKKLRRTSTGAIDYEKTAEELVSLEMFDFLTRYRLACQYCLADNIAVLWEQFRSGIKAKFYDVCLQLDNFENRNYWAFILQDDESKLDYIFGSDLQSSFCEYAFRLSAFGGNKTATQYFYRKLPIKERDSCLNRTVYDFFRYRCRCYFPIGFSLNKFSEVIIYLLSLMSPAQQMKVLKAYPCNILRYFLVWPYLDVFFDIADVIWSFLPESSYGELIQMLILNVWLVDFHYPNVFQELFIRSPINFRKQFVRWCISLFPEFFIAEDTEAIKVIFRNLIAEDRVRLVSDCEFFELLDALIMSDKLDLVEVCLREAALSKEEMKKLKGDFIGFITDIDARTIRLRKRKWMMFFQIFDEPKASADNKRNSESVVLPKVKKKKNLL